MFLVRIQAKSSLELPQNLGKTNSWEYPFWPQFLAPNCLGVSSVFGCFALFILKGFYWGLGGGRHPWCFGYFSYIFAEHQGMEDQGN